MSSLDATEAWEKAVQKYIETLSPAQQLAFKAPATADQCMQILADNRSRKKGFTRLLEFFRPLIDPLKRFEGAIDVVVQTSSGIACPIWGPLRVAITITSDHFKTLERLTFVVDKVASSIRRYQDFEVLFASHDGVRKAIGALYCDLICLCTSLLRFYSRSFSRPFLSFDSEFGSISESIDFHGAEMDRAANAAHMKEAKEAREKLSEEVKAQNLHRLRYWLLPAPVQDDLQKHQKEYMNGSFDWVIMSKEFNNWLNPTSNGFLQVFGPPGSGKSTLASFLIQHLNTLSSPVAYFFCNGGDGEKRESIHVFRTLLAQLLKTNLDLADLIIPIFHESGSVFADSHQVALKAFKTALAHQQDDVIFLVVDAVDECLLHWVLLDELQSCIRNTKAKVLITQRDPRKMYWNESESPDHVLTMRPDLAAEYIHEYTKQRVHRMTPIAGTELETQVINQVSESSEGLWLYARLMLDEVERAPSEERVKRRLASLPHGLSDLYTRILQSYEARMTDDHREFAKYLYIWLDVHDYMPDFLSDNFDRLPYRMLQLIFRFVNGSSEVFNAAALARELGTPLIEVHEIDSTFEVDFVHRSAYHHLAESSKLPSISLPLVLKSQRLKRLYRGVTAVWYFTECPDSANQLEHLRDPSLLGEFFGSDAFGSYFEMAYGLFNAFELRYLPSTLSQSEIAEVENLSRRLTDFLQSDQVLRYFEMSTIINYTGHYVQLLDNVLTALSISQSISTYPCTAFKDFCNRRCSFFLEWAYVLQETTPWRLEWQANMQIKKPASFAENDIALKMMSIAERWGNASFGNFSCHMCSPVPANGGSSKENIYYNIGRGGLKFGKDNNRSKQSRKLTVCPNCTKVIEECQLDKHLHFGCKAFKTEMQWRQRRERLSLRGERSRVEGGGGGSEEAKRD